MQKVKINVKYVVDSRKLVSAPILETSQAKPLNDTLQVKDSAPLKGPLLVKETSPILKSPVMDKISPETMVKSNIYKPLYTIHFSLINFFKIAIIKFKGNKQTVVERTIDIYERSAYYPYLAWYKPVLPNDFTADDIVADDSEHNQVVTKSNTHVRFLSPTLPAVDKVCK